MTGVAARRRQHGGGRSVRSVAGPAARVFCERVRSCVGLPQNSEPLACVPRETFQRSIPLEARPARAVLFSGSIWAGGTVMLAVA